MRYRVLPYKQGSRSAKKLAEELGGKVLKLEGSTFKPKPNDVIINWGNTAFNESAEWGPKTPDAFFNYDTDVMVHVTNKLKFFQLMKEKDLEITPKFWIDKDAIPDDAFPIVCRSILNGHSGNGIHIANNRDDLVDCPLFVQYVKKKEEYRVHVGRAIKPALTHHGGYHYEYEVISVQRKARSLGVPDDEVNWKIRNLAGGFIYTREGFTVPDSVLEIARDCLRATGLDFGAVDVIWNEHQGKPYVLEINTAPGLEGQTVKDYGNFFRGLAEV